LRVCIFYFQPAMTLQQQANQSFEDRRRGLQAAGASAATLWLPRSAWSQPRWAANPFTLGVASGAATPSSVLLWTRVHLPGVAAASLGSDPFGQAAATKLVRTLTVAHRVSIHVAGALALGCA
jgi:phosphodiesterase/alkaline phosphatase D-like protein